MMIVENILPRALERLAVIEAGAPVRDMHLAEKFGAFLRAEAAARAECLSWLFWQIGSAPYLGGGFGHFYAYAPVKIEYAIDRFAMETKRQLDVLDRRVGMSEYIAGGSYTIADIAILPWYCHERTFPEFVHSDPSHWVRDWYAR